MMLKKIMVLCIAVFVSLGSFAQYYYKDIISNNQLLNEMAKLKEQKIKSVTITSTENDGRPSEGFIVEKKINRNYTLVETFTRSAVTGPSLFTSRFTKDGLLVQTTDSSDLAVNRSGYTYNDQGKIITIESHIYSSDDDFTSEITEDHHYIYDPNGLLQQMLRVKNKRDTSIILFSRDEKNNVTIEKDTYTGKSYYYYYDGRNRLTDVVHYNEFSQKMLPDYVFEYNNTGELVQMTTTEEGGSYYYIWKYNYENGLRTKERCYSKDRRLMGTIEYSYK